MPPTSPVPLSQLLGQFGGLAVTRAMPKKRASTERDLQGLLATSTGEPPVDEKTRQNLGDGSPSKVTTLEKSEHQHPMTEQRRMEDKLISDKSPAQQSETGMSASLLRRPVEMKLTHQWASGRNLSSGKPSISRL